METLSNQTLHFCGCCKRNLPKESFYFNRRTQAPDNYCKKCRKDHSKEQRKQEKIMAFKERTRTYPVITEEKDPVVRMSLIYHALEVVAESILRKQEQKKQEELWEE